MGAGRKTYSEADRSWGEGTACFGPELGRTCRPSPAEAVASLLCWSSGGLHWLQQVAPAGGAGQGSPQGGRAEGAGRAGGRDDYRLPLALRMQRSAPPPLAQRMMWTRSGTPPTRWVAWQSSW